MSEETNDQKLEEIVTEVEPEQEQPEQDHVGAEQQPVQAVDEKAERDLRVLRQNAERAKQLELERNEYMQRLKELEQRNAQSQEPQLNPDDLVEWKHVQKEINSLKQEINQYKQQTTASTAEARLRMQYPDFEQVVNEQHIATLREEYPELAASINANPDLYTKAASAYTMIKKLNIAPDEQYAPDRNRVAQNNAKPRPLTSVSPQHGDSPLSKANAFAEGLTPDLRKSLLKEMQDAKKRL